MTHPVSAAARAAFRATRAIPTLPTARMVRVRFNLGPGFTPRDQVRLMGIADGLAVLQSAEGRVAHAHPDMLVEA